MKSHRPVGGSSRWLARAAVLSVLVGLLPTVAQADPAQARPEPPGTDARSTQAAAAVPEAQRAAVLGEQWRSSSDRAWTTAGDGDGFHVLVADGREGYAWRTAATLSEPGVETDQWIGNACVTGSGQYAAVAYAPRTFTNKSALFDRGGFSAVVDLRSGAVRKLPFRTSLAYFNPGCGAADEVVFTQAGEEDLGRTRLLRVDAAAGAVRSRTEVPGQLTSAVPTAAGIVAADGGALVEVAASGARKVLARTASVPFRLAADADGGVVYMERADGGRAAVRRLGKATAAGRGSAPTTLAAGGLAELDVTSGRGGRVFVTGVGGARKATDVSSVKLLDVPAGSQVSTDGRLAVTSVLRTAEPDPRAAVENSSAPRPLTIQATALTTGKVATFAAVPTAAPRSGRDLTPALTLGAPVKQAQGDKRVMAADPGNPADLAERYCAVPRNDPRNQAMQPKPRQVEWAVDQAVRGVLNVSRPANWKNLGMPAYTPQGLFPPLTLSGGGAVPAQVMLAIAAQESNMWQAARSAVPGVTANPLIGNYYGVDIYNNTENDDWTIRWDHADCGYGVTQVTDGMRRAGREKPGETAMPYDKQRAVALDFSANVAAGLRILQDKWNQTRNAGLIANNGNPSKIENWFFAVWAYNSGFYPRSSAAQHNGAWGVGWANNPANPKYPANRGPFLEKFEDGKYKDDYADAARPQQWGYPEKIMGWAAHPVEVLEAPDTLVSGYRKAVWNGGGDVGLLNQHNATPQPHQFCDGSNNCEWGATHVPDAPEVIGEPAGPCAHRNASGKIDLKCWYHQPTTWKADCSTTCGLEFLRFNPGYAYQEDGTAYPPRCDLSGLPAGARVIDNLPDGTPSIRPNCGRPWTNAGTFSLNYRPDSSGNYPGKMDTHQLGMGLGGHFWMANARKSGDEGGVLTVAGTWKFSAPHNGLGQIFVHLPPLGRGTTKARYEVKTAYGKRISVVEQKGDGNRWVNIGMFPFNGQPEVTLTTITPDGNGEQRVAYDAIAFVPVNSTRTIKVLHWNISGGLMNDNETAVIDRLMEEVKQRRPDVITLNEACGHQFHYLEDKLSEADYRMEGQFVTTQVPDLECHLGHQGNVVLVKGDLVKRQSYGFDGDILQEDDWSMPLNRERAVACITARFSGVGQDVKSCTTHTDGDPKAKKQLKLLAETFGPEAKNTPFILTGDTNVDSPPHSESLGALYGAPLGTGVFWEADQERACVGSSTCEVAQGGPATFRPNQEHLDYMFADRWHFHVPVGRLHVNTDVGRCNDDQEDCSDHNIVYSEFQLPYVG